MLLLLPVSVYGLLSCSEMFQQHNGVSNLPLSNGDLKTDLLKSQPFEEGFQMKTKLNGGHFACFQIVRLPDFRSHLRSGPFANQPTSIAPLKIRARLDFSFPWLLLCNSPKMQVMHSPFRFKVAYKNIF